MSKKYKNCKNKKSDLSSIDASKIIEEKNNKEFDNDDYKKSYIDFIIENFNYDQYKNYSLNEIDEKLKITLETMNSYNIINNNKSDDITNQLQIIINLLTDAKITKKTKVLNEKKEKLEKSINESTDNINNLQEKVERNNKELITVIVTIILAISIVPTAVTAIDKIDTNYILPFIGTLILILMYIILFIYSIFCEKFKRITMVILISLTILVTGSWFFFSRVSVKNEKEEYNKKIELVENKLENFENRNIRSNVQNNKKRKNNIRDNEKMQDE